MTRSVLRNNGATREQEDGTATGIFVSQASGLGGFRVTVPTTRSLGYTTLRLCASAAAAVRGRAIGRATNPSADVPARHGVPDVGVFGAQGRVTATLAAGEIVFDELWPPAGPSILPRKVSRRRRRRRRRRCVPLVHPLTAMFLGAGHGRDLVPLCRWLAALSLLGHRRLEWTRRPPQPAQRGGERHR